MPQLSRQTCLDSRWLHFLRSHWAMGVGMKRTDLLHWLGISDWVAILIAIALLLLPAVKVQTVQPATIQIQLGGK